MSAVECVKVRAGEVVFADDSPKPPPAPLLPSWPFAAMRDLGAKLATANRQVANVEALADRYERVGGVTRDGLAIAEQIRSALASGETTESRPPATTESDQNPVSSVHVSPQHPTEAQIRSEGRDGATP